MNQIFFYNYYKIGRFIFALTLFVSFHMVGLLTKIPALSIIILIYCFITFVRALITSTRLYYADFIFDIVFISSVLYFNISEYSFMTLVYLLPVFFASVLVRGRISFFFPLFACMLYAIITYINLEFFFREASLNILLHGFSFIAISVAGNAMRDKLENQDNYIKRLEEEKIRMESHRRLYRVSTDLAHELKNPLAAISTATQLLKEGRNDPELINMLSEETKRLTNLANDFLIYARPCSAPQEKVDIVDVIKVLAMHKGNEKKIILDMENSAIFEGNRTYIEVALDNIIKNAIEAANSYVMITLKTQKTSIIIDIEDDGLGVDEKQIDRVFEPFFTTKKSGTGLGLAISNRIIDSFGGKIKYSKSPIGGAKFTVTLPLATG